MKKVALSLAGVLAAAAFAPEASAVPAFARQTGMACNSCHFQHFPVLGSFGQSFKSSGFTLMGAQGKIEAEHLSIPDTLNAAMLLKTRYQKTSGTDAADTINGTTTNSGQWQIPDEFGLFFGGRVADSEHLKVGMMVEAGMTGGKIGGIVNGLRLPMVYDAGAVTISAIPFLTDTLGPAYGYELSSTGIQRAIRWAEHRKETSAAQWVLGQGTSGGAASGLAIVVKNDLGYVNVTKWSPNFAYAGGTNAVAMSSGWLRVAATPTIGSMAAHIGVALASGSNFCVAGGGTTPAAPTAADRCDTKATIVDFQGQTAVGENDLSIYVQYATAPASSASSNNLYNGKDGTARTSLTVGADYSVIPHTLSVGAAIRNAKAGLSKVQEAAGATDGDNAITLTAVYDLFQNMALHANYSMYSGSAYNATTGVNGDPSAVGANGKSLLTLMLESAW